MKTRNLSIVEFFKILQQEYLIAEFKKKIYSFSKDKSYYAKVMNFKKEKIEDISSRNNLKSIFTDNSTLKLYQSELFDESGKPKFVMNLEDWKNYYTVGTNFSFEGDVCVLLDIIGEEAKIQISGVEKIVEKKKIFKIY